MNDKPIIIAALAAFVVLATFPAWYTAVASRAGREVPPQPARQYPKDAEPCVEKKKWMVANHMNLLKTWREEVVRDVNESKKPYTARDGTVTEHLKSLTRTCMECHSKKEMCDSEGNTSCVQCHNYVRVEPDCWNCHIELKGN